MTKRRVARIPRAGAPEGAHWLILEVDLQSKGVFLYVHRSLDEACIFDHWYETEEEAKRRGCPTAR
jgi:hypothetical protein